MYIVSLLRQISYISLNQKENLIIISEDIIIYIISVMRNYQLDIELFYSKYVTGNWSQDLFNKKCSKNIF